MCMKGNALSAISTGIYLVFYQQTVKDHCNAHGMNSPVCSLRILPKEFLEFLDSLHIPLIEL